MPTDQTRPACTRESMGGVVYKPYKSCKQVHEERNSINGEDCHVTSIVKWLANGRLTIEAMSPKPACGKFIIIIIKLSVVCML